MDKSTTTLVYALQSFNLLFWYTTTLVHALQSLNLLFLSAMAARGTLSWSRTCELQRALSVNCQNMITSMAVSERATVGLRSWPVGNSNQDLHVGDVDVVQW